MGGGRYSAIVFDLGGVLINWDPRNLYRKIFAGDEPAMERFLGQVCTAAWNLEQDRGQSFADGVAELTRQHLHLAEQIAAFDHRWVEMLDGPITGSVAILRDLKARGWPLYALTNWSRDKFPHALELFDFLELFDGIVVSGEIRLVKPDRAIFDHLCARFGLNAKQTVFIDDMPANVAAAADLGFCALRFRDPLSLAADLQAVGV